MTGVQTCALPICFPVTIEVYDGLEKLGAEAAIETVEKILLGNGRAQSISQSEMAIETGPLKPAPKIHKETCRINWQQTAKQIHDFVRGLAPVPGAWTVIDDKILKIFKTQLTDSDTEGERPGTLTVKDKHLYVAGMDKWVEVLELQLAGKRRMNALDFINGNHALPEFVE